MSDVAHFENEAEAARARIVDAIEQLSDRLSPQTIVREAREEGRKALLDARDEGVEALIGLRDRAADALEDVERTIVQKPALFALGAVALGVAVTAGRRAARGGGRPVEPGDEYARYAMGDNYAADAMHVGERGRTLRARAAERLGGARDALAERAAAAAAAAARRTASAAAEVRDRASAKLADVSGSLRARFADAADLLGTHADDVGERVAAALDRARDGATDAADAVTRGVREGAANTRDAIHDNPEATIAIGVAVGIVLALVTGDQPFGTDDREV